MTRLLWIAVLGLVLPLVLSQSVEQEDDLCKDVKCKKPRGSWCQVVEVDGSPKATCVCPKTCPGDQGSPVCSVFGKQYDSACELHKYACKRRKTIPMAFDKPCIASQKACTTDEFLQFPSRLLEWFMHLKEKNEFGRIDPNRRITLVDNALRMQVAMWKFDSLDRNNDRELDKAELLKFRYSLMPLEHCAAPFFTRCAKRIQGTDTKKISVAEWSGCLNVNIGPAPESEAEPAQNQEEPVVEEEEEDVEEEEEDDAPEAV
ncbi:SPARC [Strongylocentrotus purpuratus]|uniref:SPARC n=1 Tax=Strongylocentrotus purpuratus TaxID=7668 RepID=A0A7M7TGR8_STRPU|nr:SPARC [Strongylocentrotus purpuratus]|eukprot:XP_786595.1 PREDICTED: SPARC [Strongylocentrotus purpuratus]